MVFDASPRGLGGILYLDGKPIGWSAYALSDHGERIHPRRRGDSHGQQVWECLAVLVGLRRWRPTWTSRKASLHQRSDSTTSFQLASKLKATGRCNLIAREVALIYSTAAYEPKMIQQLPGVNNIFADFSDPVK